MNNDHSGAFWWGLVIGIVIMNFWPQKYQGKTAKEWQQIYSQSQDDWQSAYSNVNSCITDLSYDGTDPEYSYDSSLWIYDSEDSTTSPTDSLKSDASDCLTKNPQPQEPDPSGN